jgi:hypothetical protein
MQQSAIECSGSAHCASRVTDALTTLLQQAAVVAGCESTLINQSTRLHFSLVGGGCKYFGAEKLYY